MMGHDVLFDVDNKILGWAESDCDYPKMLEKYFDGTFDLPSNDEPDSDMPSEPITVPSGAPVPSSGSNKREVCMCILGLWATTVAGLLL